MAACTMGALRAVLWRWPAWLALAGLVACGRPPAVATVADGSPSTVAGATYKRPAVIDFHGHLSLDGVERIREILATNGIERMVNLSGGSGSRGTTQWEMARELSRQLQGRIINFALAGWRVFGEPGWAEREAASLQRAVDEFGFAGLKVPKGLGLGYTDPEGRLVAPDDPRIGPLWRKAGELGVPVCIHIADPRAFWWPVSPKNERWDELGVHPYWAYGVIPAALLAQLPPQMQQAIAERPKVRRGRRCCNRPSGSTATTARRCLSPCTLAMPPRTWTMLTGCWHATPTCGSTSRPASASSVVTLLRKFMSSLSNGKTGWCSVPTSASAPMA
jgi:hypothetical protein